MTEINVLTIKNGVICGVKEIKCYTKKDLWRNAYQKWYKKQKRKELREKKFREGV